MITLSKFERLVMTNIPQSATEPLSIGEQGEFMQEWVLSLSGLNKHAQFTQMQSLLGELLTVPMDDKDRLKVVNKLMPAFERLIGQLHGDYIYEHQNLSAVQQQSMTEVRALYFLMILIYKNIASRTYVEMHQGDDGGSWFKKILKSLCGDKDVLTVSVYQMMGLYVRLLMEYALTYQRAPRVVWQQLNFWYLRVAQEGLVYHDVHKFAKYLPQDTIHQQYQQACISSFVNFFAYRRQDILTIFKVLPTWATYVEATFEARSELKIFVNLLGNHPPEVITPYATVNPYSDEYQCLFFDATRLVAHLQEVRAGEFVTATDAQSVFEARLAQMVLIAFDRYAKQDRIDRFGQQKAELLTGFSAIFQELSGGRRLTEVINQRALLDTHQPKSVKEALNPPLPKEQVKLTSRSDTLARFNYVQNLHEHNEDVRDMSGNNNVLQVFGVFAIKSMGSKSEHPWRLGIAHWVDRYADEIEVDGRILGRILLVCGVRLLRNTGRSQDFVHALLIDGDGLNTQSTLIVPRFHFHVGDEVLMRIDTKELQLRLERNLLSTDEIEQYQIVRMSV